MLAQLHFYVRMQGNRLQLWLNGNHQVGASTNGKFFGVKITKGKS
jgi:hypothetical protein